jgi:hypothetical protein
MFEIGLQLSDEVYRDLVMVAEACSIKNQQQNGGTTHGELDVKALLHMLAEDAAMGHSRPGSWEAAHMLDLLASHGYHLR